LKTSFESHACKQLDAEIQFFQRETQKLMKSRQSEMQLNIAQQNLKKDIVSCFEGTYRLQVG
jgi:hypothetical protein